MPAVDAIGRWYQAVRRRTAPCADLLFRNRRMPAQAGFMIEPAEQPRLHLNPSGLTRRVPLLPHQMTAARTPTDQLFMLAHLGVGRSQQANWSLVIEGMVRQPLRLSLAQLAAMPQVRLEAVHQCAGSPQQPDVPTRRVANVMWEGVRLESVLAAAGVSPEARMLWSDGADRGDFAGETVPFFRKDLPLARLPADVLLATQLNGAPLPGEHGGPLRLVVPGFYGTNSVKWIWRMVLADRRADSLFTTTYYNDHLADGSLRPVWALAPEAIFTTPAPGDRLGEAAHLCGWAWSDAQVVRVQVSDDEGASWQEAEVAARHQRAWQAWSMTWQFRHLGPTRLLVRAIDAAGASQPMDGARNAIHSVEVKVR